MVRHMSRCKYTFLLAAVLAALLAVTPLFLSEESHAAGDASVIFTVYCQDASGSSLMDPHTFYGTVGDKPEVEAPSITGYETVVPVLTKTLSSDSKENIFTFVYKKTKAEITKPAEKTEESSENVEGSNTEPEKEDTSNDSGEGEGIAEASVPLTPPDAGSESETVPQGDNAETVSAERDVLDLDTESPIAEPGKKATGIDDSGNMMMIILAVTVAAFIVVLVLLRRKKKTGKAEGPKGKTTKKKAAA